VLDRLDVRRVDGVRGVEQTAGGGLLDEPVEDLVDNVLEIGEKPINRVSGWRFAESAVIPDEAVSELSCNRTCTVYILVLAVQKAAKGVWWFVNLRSPPLWGVEHVVLQQKLELKMFEL